MFLSSIKGAQGFEAVNVDFISRNITPQGFTLTKQKNKDVEVALNISSFTLEKNFINMTTFVFRLDKTQFICTGYHNGRIVKEKQCKYQSDIPSILIDIFNCIKLQPEDEPIRFDMQLEIMQDVCTKIEQKQNRLQLDRKISTILHKKLKQKMEKNAYEKVINDSIRLISHKEESHIESGNLIDPLLKVQSCKQSLQTAIMAYEQESAYLSNVKERIKDNIDTLKANPIELSSSTLNETTFNEYVTYQTKLKEIELKQKYLIG